VHVKFESLLVKEGGASAIDRQEGELSALLRQRLGLDAKVSLLPPQSFPRSGGKADRVVRR